jgi:hypothetical protein
VAEVMIQDPMLVKLIEPESELERLAGVLIGSLGVAGVITLLAVIVGFGVGALMFWLRSRST